MRVHVNFEDSGSKCVITAYANLTPRGNTFLDLARKRLYMLAKPLSEPQLMPAGKPFHGKIEDVLFRIDGIDPRRYDKTRNYLDGAVTWLSPFITHGIINTHTVAERVLEKHPAKSCYRLLYELAWREYFHRVWQENDDVIFGDFYHPQEKVESEHVPQAIVDGSTGIHVLDDGIQTLRDTGLMHNHLRMWLAGTVCNMAHTHWSTPARWLHYHLLDGDLASNTLSWQWIAGTFSHKKYIANQENLNKYSRSKQHDTWLDIDYDSLSTMATPECMQSRCTELNLTQNPLGELVPSDVSGKIALRSLWNLNPEWAPKLPVDSTVLFIEQSQIDAWPMAQHRWDFIEHWVKQLGIPIWRGSVEELEALESSGVEFVREEYPACAHWPGQVMERIFHFGVPDNDYRSFSQFWKQVK